MTTLKSITSAARPLWSLLHNDADRQYDGMLIGAGGRALPPSTPLAMIPPIMPRSGSADQTVVFVNGLPFDKQTQAKEMQTLADIAGCNVVGIHNATEGLPADLLQVAKDKLKRGDNPAVTSVKRLVQSELSANRSIHLVAHSQGGLIVSRALTELRDRWLKQGLSTGEVERRLSKVEVETYGAAATRFPDGPRYTHYINRLDPVPQLAGLGLPVHHYGKGARVVTFSEPSFKGLFPGHDFESVYLKHRVAPFEE